MGATVVSGATLIPESRLLCMYIRVNKYLKSAYNCWHCDVWTRRFQRKLEPLTIPVRQKIDFGDCFEAMWILPQSPKSFCGFDFGFECDLWRGKLVAEEASRILLLIDYDVDLYWKKRLNSCFLKHIKGSLISDRFSRWLEFPEKCDKNYAEHLLFRWIELKVYSAVIWHLFWEKTFWD